MLDSRQILTCFKDVLKYKTHLIHVIYEGIGRM